ncbi:MAG: hypothetical protein NZ695_07595 [Dehalococcoidia bacterium]|nr:hypothetical protein [Dehalococcoidia bacterium]MDW8008838.1 hypothetical protein [Chloroflexota bacterium]
MPGEPLLLLIALHLRSMLAMASLFWRVRRLERELRALPGVLRVHRWVSRRSLLLTVWCEGPEAADACLASPGLASLAQRAGEGRQVRLWAERYALLPGALHLGARGAPPASADAQGDGDGPEGREGLAGRYQA